MDEDRNDAPSKVSSQNDSSKKDAKPHKDKNAGKRFSDKWKDLKGEFHKIIWPSKKELLKQTTTVIITSAIVGGVIVVLDAVFAVGVTTFSSLLNR